MACGKVHGSAMVMPMMEESLYHSQSPCPSGEGQNKEDPKFFERLTKKYFHGGDYQSGVCPLRDDVKEFMESSSRALGVISYYNIIPLVLARLSGILVQDDARLWHRRSCHKPVSSRTMTATKPFAIDWLTLAS